MTLDTIVAILTAVLAGCAFSVHIMSNPSRDNWMTFPRWVRWPLGVTGLLLLIRTVNLLTISGDTTSAGHVNYEGLALTISMTCTVLALTLFAAMRKLHGKGWDRVRYVLNFLRDHPNAAPVMMDPHEVLEIHHAMGQPAAAGTRPAEVITEAARAQRMAGRSRG